MRVCAVQVGWTAAGQLDGVGCRVSKSARTAMPLAAQIVDEWREMFGADFVNAKIRRSEVARKRIEAIKASDGPEAAERWRKANWQECAFVAVEAGQTIGLADPFGEGVLPCVDERELRKAGADSGNGSGPTLGLRTPDLAHRAGRRRTR